MVSENEMKARMAILRESVLFMIEKCKKNEKDIEHYAPVLMFQVGELAGMAIATQDEDMERFAYQSRDDAFFFIRQKMP